MGLIFWFSAQPATDSGAMSGSITKFFYHILEIIGLSEHISVDLLHTLIRKGAHFTIYFILGVLLYRAIHFKSVETSILKEMGIGLMICMLYACSDEMHQVFVAGRSGQLKDVMIDISGSTLGMTAFHYLDKIFK
jgi:VanZ family protein